MINTTDFLDALRSFEYVVEQKNLTTDLKTQVKKQLLNELSKVEEAIYNIDLGDEMEIFEGTNETLKNL